MNFYILGYAGSAYLAYLSKTSPCSAHTSLRHIILVQSHRNRLYKNTVQTRYAFSIRWVDNLIRIISYKIFMPCVSVD
jgi:hypothetical protein